MVRKKSFKLFYKASGKRIALVDTIFHIYWHQWRADTEAIARNVEKYFLDKGMNGAGGDTPNYVYIF